jgi:lysosomal-associated membrane protein 1/2
MEYTLANGIFQLNDLNLDYVIDSSFPNVSQSELGPKSVSKTNLDLFSANRESSYKCNSLTTVELSEKVSLEFRDYQGEPFIKDQKLAEFDTAIECPADISNTSKLVPIIVGSALAVLVVLVLVAYIIGRRKHRPGYQQV